MDLRAVLDGLEERTSTFACQGIDYPAGRPVAVLTTPLGPVSKLQTFFPFHTEVRVQFMTTYGIIFSHIGVEK